MIKRHKLIIFLLVLSFGCLSDSLYAQDLGKITCICIDAGHGGKDPGTIFGKIREKDITLAVALKLGNLIKANYPDIKIVYTRDKDKAVDLHERGKIANRAKAQLFISIHVNGVKETSASGIETFVLGLHKSEESLKIAMKENEAIHYEEDYSVKYDGFDPQKTESYIMFNFMKNTYLQNSMLLAERVQKDLVKDTKLRDRQVKQAGFIVLKDVAMPSILVEIGFISNAKDRQYMTSAAGQETMAKSIFNAFKTYKNNLEQNSKVLSTDKETKETVKENIIVENENTTTKKELYYAIQVASSKTKIKDLKYLKLTDKIEEHYNGDRYRYHVGKTKNYNEVQQVLRKTKNTIKDCFIIAIYNGDLIPVAEARKLEK